MASMAGSKGGINDKLKKKLMILRRGNTKNTKNQSFSQDTQQKELKLEENGNAGK